MEVGPLLVEWRGATSQPAGTDTGSMGGYHQPVCVETVVGSGCGADNNNIYFVLENNPVQ